MKFTSRVISFIAAAGLAAVDANMSIPGHAKSATKLMTFSRRLDQQQQYNNANGNNQYGGNYQNQNQNANNYQGGYGNNGQNNGGGQNQNYQNYQNGGQGGYGDGEEESLTFLNNYSLKLLSCIQGEQIVNYESGEAEPSTVVFRLCPANTCDVNSEMGCDSGFGDYAVGITTFLEAYMESQEDNDNQDGYSNSLLAYNSYGQEFDASEYLECAQYEVEEEANQDYNYYQYNNNNGQQYENQQYNNNNYQGGGQQNGNYNYYQDMDIFIGPACSADGTTIGLSLFMEDTCSYAAGDDMDFAKVAYGWDSLPFSSNLISMNCKACYGPDEDYNYELSELCTETYSASVSSCEQNMTTYSYYGQKNNGCGYVESLVQAVYGNANDDDIYGDGASATTSLSESFMATLSTGEARAFIACMVIFCIAAIGGTALWGYMNNKKKRAQALAAGKLMEDGDYEPPTTIEETDEFGNPLVKRRSSVVALVKDGVYYCKQGIQVGVDSMKGSVAKATTKTDKMMAPCSDEQW
mmetsp:Transcript_47485/g.53122  ORF Transcript_47485/g.53122 Transcript_47485/m.53122 type:complete len:523 (-) Transcript_47485:201-1769(-)